MPPIDDDLKDILVEIPSTDIALGHDADGLPKTVAADADEDKEPKTPALDPEKLRKDLEEQRRETDSIRQARMREKSEADAALAAEREARAALEGKLTETTGVAWNAHEARLRAEFGQIDGAYKSTQRLMETTKRELRAAKEAGDMDREIAAQEALAEAHADLRALEQGRANAEDEIRRVRSTLEARAAEVKAAPEPKKAEAKPEAKTEAATPEQWISQFPRKTQAWLTANKDYVTDPAKHQALQAFAGEWVADYGNATLHTPAFIEALNEKFVPKEIEVAEDRDEPEVVAEKAAAKPKAKTASAAPVSRNASLFSSRNMDASQVRLPPKLAAFVRQSGLDPTAYALSAVADIKAGKLPKNFLDPDYPHDF